MLSKLKLLNIEEIINKKGNIKKILNKNNKFFKGFGECYLNNIKKNQTKGWNLHTKYTCIIFVLSGIIKFTLTDNFKKKKIITIQKKNNKLLIIPPKTWFKFKALNKNSFFINFIEDIHNDNEIKKKLI